MKVAIAHGSQTCTRAIALALQELAAHRLLWNAQDGESAIARAEAEPPDLLLLDVSIRGPGSLEVTRRVVARGVTILLLADHPGEHTTIVYEAMGLGALDVTCCPQLSSTGTLRAHEPLVAKMRSVAKLVRASKPPAVKAAAGVLPKLLAIGASTGGPQALLEVLSKLPRDLNAAIVIVQHVDREFSAGLATWLQQETGIVVSLALPGCKAVAGAALLASTNDHLILTAQRRFNYTSEPKELPYRPSVDVLFNSLADHWGKPGVAVLLTGMGKDGARGMKRLQQAGWHTIAQDQASSVVFGMPRAAIELGAAQQVVTLSHIADSIAAAFRMRS